MANRGEAVDVVYLDFEKAFDKASHGRLLGKMRVHGIKRKPLALIAGRNSFQTIGEVLVCSQTPEMRLIFRIDSLLPTGEDLARDGNKSIHGLLGTGMTLLILLALSCQPTTPIRPKREVNVARTGLASHSSTSHDNIAILAIDGNMNTKTSCSLTQKSLNPWWLLDLRGEYSVREVRITNRMDCCSERILGAEIYIGSSPLLNGNSTNLIDVDNELTGKREAKSRRKRTKYVQHSRGFVPKLRKKKGSHTNQNNNPTCHILRKHSYRPRPWLQAFYECAITGDHCHHVTPISFSCGTVQKVSGKISVRCEGFVGRYLTITIPGKNKILSVCEVEVFASMVPELHDIGRCKPRDIAGCVQPTGHSPYGINTEDPACVPYDWKIANITPLYKKVEPAPATASSTDDLAFNVSTEDVRRALRSVNPRKAAGPDGIPGIIFYPVYPMYTPKEMQCNFVVQLVRNDNKQATGETDPGPECATAYGTQLGGRQIRSRSGPSPVRAVFPQIISGAPLSSCTRSCDDPASPSWRYLALDLTALDGPTRSIAPDGIAIKISGPYKLLHHDKLTINVPPTVNLALSGWATQSSTRKSAEAYLAIHGRASTLRKLKSCTETNPTNDPWWMIDLHGIYQVSVVRITNRRDCCSEQLQGAEIRIGNSSKDGGMSNELRAVAPCTQRPSATFQQLTESQSPVTYGVMPVSFSCGTIQVMSAQRFTFVCEDFTGRFVSVIIPGKNKTLTLCEVEVYGEKLASLNSEGMFLYTSHAFSQGHSVGSVFGVLCSLLFTYYRKDYLKQTNSREDYPSSPTVNVALRGTAYQSSTHRYGFASKAIDGDIKTDGSSGMCSQTKSTNDPGWSVDLEISNVVTTVIIINREDCCREQLLGAQVYIGDSLILNGNVNYNRQGPFDSGNNVLQSLNKGSNANRPQSIPSTYSVFWSNKCSYPPSLRVSQRLMPVVPASPEPPSEEGASSAPSAHCDYFSFSSCGTVISVVNPIIFHCDGFTGRYVNIFIPGNNKILTLCEVQVFGTKLPSLEMAGRFHHRAVTRRITVLSG
ncbi:uncharacterized protein LOC129706219 [Leucoraja erinacea]|uniref:uncharacterized protein LOC129706219 n=1 Tax=Leucoraja erinaceus TaxID=7782 RepID=UPI002457F41F|nr:uncharacterized protein LOC129706219 [Leucoraja erinacea]